VNRFTGRQCYVTISIVFICDPEAKWNVVSPDVPGNISLNISYFKYIFFGEKLFI
jgi:hypothetical protein